MRWFILFFILLLLGAVVAEDVEIQVESPVNRTYDSSTSEVEGSSFGYVFMALGFLILGFLVFTLCVNFIKKKKGHVGNSSSLHSSLHKGFFSRFFHRQKTSPKVLSQSHYAKMEKVQDEEETVQQRNEQLMSLKEDILHEYPKVLDEEVRRVLKVTDDLLGEIPEDKVTTFVNSPDFEVYKKVMKKVHEPLHENTEDIEKMKKVLDLFERGVVDGDEARKLLGLPVRHVHIVKTEKKDKEQVLAELKKVRHETN